MEFTGFRPEGLDLLVENRVRNSKEFYESSRDKIKELVQEPFYALIERLAPAMLQLDPQIMIQPRRMLSRIRRDTRYTRDKTLYRDHMWITFSRCKGAFAARPCFYFEITPEFWGYGCGYYQAPAAEMRLAREMMLAEDPLFLAAFRAVHPPLTLYGDRYKRQHFPEAPDAYQDWLNRKNLGASAESTGFQPLFDGSFVEPLIDGFRQIAPLYAFLCAVKQRAGTEES